MKLSSNVCNRCRLVCVKFLFKSEQICGCCCKMLRGSLFWGTHGTYHRLARKIIAAATAMIAATTHRVMTTVTATATANSTR